MRFVIANKAIDIVLKENHTHVIVIEAPRVFADICNELWNSENGKDGAISLMEKEKVLSFAKTAEVIWNPFSLSNNERKIIDGLYTELNEIALERFYSIGQELNSMIIGYLDKLSSTVPYPITMEMDFSPKTLMKLYSVRMEEDGTTLLERMIQYVRISHQINKRKVFFLVNMRSYLTEEDWELFYQACYYEKIWIISLEGYSSQHISSERKYILDKELCWIDLTN